VTLEVRFESEAARELDEATLRYEGERAGLGLEFLDAVDRAVSMIERWPEAAPRATELPDNIFVRRAPVRAFPYRLVYLRTATALRVLAVAHDAREPGYWTSRIPNP
jgi:toxin ParE1/3/4